MDRDGCGHCSRVRYVRLLVMIVLAGLCAAMVFAFGTALGEGAASPGAWAAIVGMLAVTQWLALFRLAQR